MADRPGILRLEPVDGPDLETVELAPAPEERVLGRSSQCDVILPHEAVSRRNTTIAFAEGPPVAWHVRDVGSRHGTYLNNVRLEADETLPLHEGDLLRVGPWTFVVRGAPAAPPPMPEEAKRRELESLAARANETYATQASLFDVIRDDETFVRELGWETFAQRYGPIIIGFARNSGLSGQDADDVLQDVLMSFFKAAPGFEYDPSKGRFRGYLKRMTLNAIRQRWRREKHEAHVGLDPEVPESASTTAHWDRQWMEQLLRRAMHQVRGEFELRTIEAFDLYGRRGLPAEAVAERLGMSLESVRHAKSRVARRLRAIIDELRGDDGLA